MLELNCGGRRRQTNNHGYKTAGSQKNPNHLQILLERGAVYDYALERLLANADSGRNITVGVLNI
jgi:hypothetical protein